MSVGLGDDWGFCDVCAFIVAVDEGLRIDHRFNRIGSNDEQCNGSGWPPVEPVPFAAMQRQRVSLYKEDGRSRRRAWWQRQRLTKRELARIALKELRESAEEK